MRFKPASRAAQYVRAAMKCGHWEDAERADHHQAFLRHIATGEEIGYPRHDGGNDLNAARNAAAAMGALCGCVFVQPRGRKRSRKPVSMYDPKSPSAIKARQAVERERAAEDERRRVLELVEARERELSDIRYLMGGYS